MTSIYGSAFARLVVVLSAVVLTIACSSNPATMSFALIGQMVDAAELKKFEPELIGQPPEAADKVFGRRFDTLGDVDSDTLGKPIL